MFVLQVCADALLNCLLLRIGLPSWEAVVFFSRWCFFHCGADRALNTRFNTRFTYGYFFLEKENGHLVLRIPSLLRLSDQLSDQLLSRLFSTVLDCS